MAGFLSGYAATGDDLVVTATYCGGHIFNQTGSGFHQRKLLGLALVFRGSRELWQSVFRLRYAAISAELNLYYHSNGDRRSGFVVHDRLCAGSV